MPLQDSNNTSTRDNTLIELIGADGTAIGNDGDRLKVDAALTPQNSDLINGRLFSTAVSVNAATGSSDNAILLFKNPVGSGKTIYIQKLTAGTDVTNVSVTIKVFANPTTTAAGSTLTKVALKRVSSPTASIAEASSLPTATSNGTLMFAVPLGQNAGAFDVINSALISLEAGQSILITAAPNSNNRQATLTLIWSEVSA
jgi:hypothetical protein